MHHVLPLAQAQARARATLGLLCTKRLKLLRELSELGVNLREAARAELDRVRGRAATRHPLITAID